MTRLKGLRAVAAAAAAVVAMVAPALARATTGSQVFTTAGEHAFTVPAGVTSLQVLLVGGSGGGGRFPGGAGGAGGQGATVTATVAVTPGEALFAEVAGNGENGSPEGSGEGGIGGGAVGGEIFFIKGGGGGGGASDLRTCGLKCASPSLPTRLLVAGGGGGGGGDGGPTAVTGGPGGSTDRSGTAGSVLTTLQGGEGGKRGTASSGGSGGAVSWECPKLASCSQPGVEGAGGKGGDASAAGGGGGGGGGIFGGGGGGGGDGFESAPLSFENAGGGGGGGGASGVSATASARVSGFTQLLTALGAEPSITLSWTIPVPLPAPGSPSAPSTPSGPGNTSGPASTSTRPPVPSVSGLAITPTRFRRGGHAATIAGARVPTGAVIAFALTQGATVTLAVEQPHTGVRSGGRCLPAGRHSPRGPACTRWLALPRKLVRQAHAGADRIHFEGVLDGGLRLPPGRYRLSLRAAAAGGSANAPQHPGFTLLP